MLFSYAIFAYAQNSTGEPTEEEIGASGIAFPIAELGNCASKEECKRYCNVPDNIEACARFAEEHGLMSKEDAAQARKFGAKIKRGEGPGGCRGPEECRAFCTKIQNLETCTAFADEQGIKDEHVEQGKKILEYRRAGGGMPGDCDSEENCKTYCSDFSHTEECFEFAKKAGILKARGKVGVSLGGGPSRNVGQDDELNEDQFQKLIELTKSGETPGGCSSKESCETYCQDSTHLEECLAFGEKVGFIEREHAEKIRKTGGKGPGGCNSSKSCQAYCNDPANQEECFKFAEDHGFIKPEEVKQAKEGMVRLRAGIEQAPDEVKECLKSSLGENILYDIQSGKLVPGQDIGERVRACFEKIGGDHGGSREMFKDAPSEVRVCLREKLGGDYEGITQGKTIPTPEMADTFRVCFQKMQFEQGSDGPGGESMGASPGEFLRSAPPGVAQCMKEKLGEDFVGMRSGGTEMSLELKDKMRSCFEDFHPGEMQGQMQGQGEGEHGRPGFAPPQVGGPGGMPGVAECAKAVLGDDTSRLARNEITAEERQQISVCVTEKVKSQMPPGSFNRTPGGEGGQFPDGRVMPPDGMSRPPENMTPEEQRKMMEMQTQQGGDHTAPPGGYTPTPTPPADAQTQYREQYQDQYQQQYQEQYNQQYQQQYNQQQPPAGTEYPQYQPTQYPNQYPSMPPPGSTPPPEYQQPASPPPTSGSIINVFEWLVKSLLAS